MKFRVRSVISSLLIGLTGAALGGLLFQWASLLPHAIHIGACVGAIVPLITKQAFVSNW